jgi:uncharacterized protein YdhG (YjbR/CyaY superfamily)
VPIGVRTIDEYLAALSRDKRASLEKLRRTIRKIVPDAEECISDGMPAFRLGRVVVAGFQATTKGCSYHPVQRRFTDDQRTIRP